MKNLLTIENKYARVKLDDTVDQYSRRELAEQMKKAFGPAALQNPEFEAMTASSENEIDTLEIEINSPGGSVLDGMLIYNEIKAMRARGVRVVAIVNVLAASMGSVIAMAADEVKIAKNGQMMIHDASIMAYGTAKYLQKMAGVLDGMSNEIADIYAEKTGMTREECRALMVDETWMDSAKCIQLKFADSLFDISKPTNTINNEMSLLARLTNPSSEEAVAKISGLEAMISEKDAEIVALNERLATAENALQEAATLRAEVSEIQTKLAEAEAKVTETEQAYADLQAEAESEKADVGKLAAKKAAEMAAEIGVGQTPIPDAENQATDHIAVMNSLPPAEKRAYWKKYQKEFKAQLSK